MKHFIIILTLLCSWQLAAAIWNPDRYISPDLPEWANVDYANGRMIYVDAAANAVGADGSVKNPFPTISLAILQAQAHDEIIISAGTYHENLRISRPHITLRADTLQQVKVIVPYNDSRIYFALRIDAGAHYARVIGLDISGGYFYTVSLESDWSQSNPKRTGVSHVLLSQNRLHGSGRDVVKLKPMAEHIVIERNEIFNSGQRDPGNAEGIDNVNAHFMTVQDNYIHDIATTGLYFKGGARNTVAQRNLIRNTGFAGILVGFDTSPAFFDLTRNPEMYEALNSRVDNNIIDGTQASGIGIYAAKDSLIRHNTVVNSAQVFHSALFFGNVLQDRSPEGNRPPAVNVEVHANIFHVDSSDNPLVSIRYFDDSRVGPLSSLEGMPVMSQNVYASTGSYVGFADGRPDSFLARSADLQQWQQHIGSDQGSKAGELSWNSFYYPLLDGNGVWIDTPVLEHDYFFKTRLQKTQAGAIGH